VNDGDDQLDNRRKKRFLKNKKKPPTNRFLIEKIIFYFSNVNTSKDSLQN